MTREEHLQWCKERARAYLDRGDVVEAITSMLSDLGKHEETRDSIVAMAPLGLLYAKNQDFDGARRFIEGFR